MAYKVAVVGATGNVGREILSVLVERQFPASEVVALASTRSIGTEVSFGDGTPQGQGAGLLRLQGHRHLPDVGGRSHRQGMGAPKIAAQGCIVIDNSSAWRMDRDVPLVVPEG